MRPSVDLFNAIGTLPNGPIVDLGCGTGLAAGLLAQLKAPLIGIDNSPAMLADAKATGHYSELITADIAGWIPDRRPALIFSNAVLHWLPDHGFLMPKLVSRLASGGTLAVQMPYQNAEPSHRLWVELAREMFPQHVAGVVPPKVLHSAEYHRILAELGTFDLWETTYFQHLPARDEGHPVRLFTESTFAKPFLDELNVDERSELIAAYEAAAPEYYTSAPDGSVLFPFKRLFFTLKLS